MSPQAKASTKAKAGLRLENPRIEKIEAKGENLYTLCESHRYGFKLSGYHGSFEFYCADAYQQDEWVEKLRRVCISHNITYRYTFGDVLGKGSFAKARARN